MPRYMGWGRTLEGQLGCLLYSLLILTAFLGDPEEWQGKWTGLAGRWHKSRWEKLDVKRKQLKNGPALALQHISYACQVDIWPLELHVRKPMLLTWMPSYLIVWHWFFSISETVEFRIAWDDLYVLPKPKHLEALVYEKHFIAETMLKKVKSLPFWRFLNC